MMAYVCNSSTWEVEIGTIGLQGQPGQKVRNILSEK
jgi:hypothetical protein